MDTQNIDKSSGRIVMSMKVCVYEYEYVCVHKIKFY